MIRWGWGVVDIERLVLGRSRVGRFKGKVAERIVIVRAVLTSVPTVVVEILVVGIIA